MKQREHEWSALEPPPFLTVSSPIPVFHCQKQFQLKPFLYSKDHSEP